MLKPVLTDKAPKPGGHYSQAIIHNGVVYVAGQLPIDPVTGEKRVGTIEEQTKLVLNNVRAILQASGSDIEKVIRMTIYISDIELWGRVNTVYAEFFGAHRPARTVVPTKTLHFGFQIEVDAIAAID
jgi:2-iminobutanoate/2-iminopropanoate deaminase